MTDADTDTDTDIDDNEPDLSELAERVIDELDPGQTIGDKIVLSRRQLVAIAGGGLSLGALGTFGVSDAQAQNTVGTIGTSSSPVDVKAATVDATNTVTESLSADDSKSTNDFADRQQAESGYFFMPDNGTTGKSGYNADWEEDANKQDIGRNGPAQSLSMTLGSAFAHATLRFSQLKNESGGNQDMGIQINGVTGGYISVQPDGTITTGQTMVPFDTYTDGQFVQGWVDMYASWSNRWVCWPHMTGGSSIPTSVGINSIADPLDSITVRGSSGDINAIGRLFGWSIQS